MKLVDICDTNIINTNIINKSYYLRLVMDHEALEAIQAYTRFNHQQEVSSLPD